MKRSGGARLLTVYYTIFLDFLGAAIVYPILAPLLLDKSRQFFPPTAAGDSRIWILSLLLMAYPLAQFLAAPLLGAISDRKGRRPVLLISVGGTLFSYALSAYGIQIESLPVLFVSRLLGGIFAGNTSTCLAAIADVTREKKMRARRFGYSSIFSGIAFIVGPLVGGVMSEPDIGFNAAMPLWIAAFLAWINIVVLYVWFVETCRGGDPKKSFSFFEGIYHIYEAFTTPLLWRLFAFFFFIITTMDMLFLFVSTLLTMNYGLSPLGIGIFFAIDGLIWSLGTSLFNNFLLRWGSLRRITALASIAALGTLALLVPTLQFSLFALCIALATLEFSVLWPNAYALISSRAGEEIQGKVMGMTGALASAATIAATLFGGRLLGISVRAFFIGTLGLMALASICYVRFALKEGKVAS